MNEPHDQHYSPQFYLRNFAVDPDRKKIPTLAKSGPFAVWKMRSIKAVGYERDLYVSVRRGVPVSVETVINRRIETPISETPTWEKIASGQTDALDISDKPILYALIRHLEVRTPHALATQMELAQMAASADSPIPFTDEEREHYAFMRARPDLAKAYFDGMAASLDWTKRDFAGCGLAIMRSPIPLRASTTPVLLMRAPANPAISLPYPGMTPFQRFLTLNRTTIASLVVGKFSGGFMNTEISVEVARGLNRHFVRHLAQFDRIRHVITDRGDDLLTDMTWAPYDLVADTAHKMTFRRRPTASVQNGNGTVLR